jgi:hypothetical protein
VTGKRFKVISAIVALLIGLSMQHQFRYLNPAATTTNSATSTSERHRQPTDTSTNATHYGQLDKNHFGLEEKYQILAINNPTKVIPPSKSTAAKNLIGGHSNATSKEGVNLFLNFPSNRRPYIYTPGWDSSPVVVEEYKLLFFTQPKVRLFRREERSP